MADARASHWQIGDFNGDYEQLSEVVRSSWAENRQQAIRYTPAYLASLFAQPGFNFGLAPSFYPHGTLAAFIAGFPRTAIYEGRRLRVLVSALLTVAGPWKNSGAGAMMWGELARRAEAAGFHGMLSYCVVGEDMNRMIAGISRVFKYPASLIYTVSYMAAPVRATGGGEGVHGDAARLLQAAGQVRRTTNSLVREWTPEEAEWQCRERYGAVTAATGDGEPAVVTGYVAETSSEAATTCVILDDLLWDAVEPARRTGLMRFVLESAASRGATIAIAPVTGAVAEAGLICCGFRRTPRAVNIYYSDLTRSGPIRPLDSFQLDIF